MATRGEKTQIAKTLVGITLSPSQRRSPCLVQYSGANLGRPFFLTTRETIIGRDPRASLHVNEKKVSRQHAKVFKSQNYVSIEDLRSSNGTFVNGKRIEGIKKLRDGDMVGIGPAQLKFFKAGNIEQLFYDNLYRLATIDEKTQVFNDKYFLSTLRSEIEISKSFGQPLSLILYDLDFFKKVNDTFGHLVGDLILQGTAKIASQAIRKNDVLCRYGGEEFAIIAKETDAGTALNLADRVRKAIERHPFSFRHKGQVVKCVQTVSAGVVQMTSRTTSVAALIKAVDKNLYRAKKAGRNRVSG